MPSFSSPKDYKEAASGVWTISVEEAEKIKYVIGAVNTEYVGIYEVESFHEDDRLLQDPDVKIEKGIRFVFTYNNPIHLSSHARSLDLKMKHMQAYKKIYIHD